MNANEKITKKDKVAASELLESITPIEGEKRVAYKCSECGQIFARRFIPFGIGRGLTVKACLCQLTAHRNSYLVAESAP